MTTSFLRAGNGSNAHNAISLNAKASADYANKLAETLARNLKNI